jgi:hypothetical protein
MPRWLPATLLNGRLRTSTLLLSLLFVAVLALYLQVRPSPAGGSSNSAPDDPRSQPTTSVAPTTSTTRTATTRSTAPTSTAAPTTTTPGATGSSASPQGTVEP